MNPSFHPSAPPLQPEDNRDYPAPSYNSLYPNLTPAYSFPRQESLNNHPISILQGVQPVSSSDLRFAEPSLSFFSPSSSMQYPSSMSAQSPAFEQPALSDQDLISRAKSAPIQ